MSARKGGFSCVVRGCPSKTGEEISLFSIPADRSRAELWLKAANREDLLSRPALNHRNYKMCEKHFKPEYMHKGNERKSLFGQAYPTIFSHNLKKVIRLEEHGEHLSTDPNKCENTTNMQENETSDKKNISISITKEQLEQKCLTCFIRNGTIDVFTNHHEGILFRDLLKKFSLAEIHQSDGLPQRICTYCSSFIINLCTFKKEIDKSLIKLKAAFYQLDNQNITESQCERSNKSKAALQQVDNLNISESQCEGSDDSKVPLNVYKVMETLKIQVYVEGKEDNESKNEIIQQIIAAPSQGNNKNEYINKDRSALEESRFDEPNADSGSHNNFKSLFNNISNTQRKYLRTRQLLMSKKLKRSNTSVLLDHNYIKSDDRNKCNTNKKRGKEKKKKTLCPSCKKGQKFRINKFLNRQICFDKYFHCDKYTCTYCHSKNLLWLKYGAHNRGKHRNKHFYV